MLPILQDKNVLTMSSREIAILTKKLHKNVTPVILSLHADDLLTADIQPSTFEHRGNTYTEYNLCKRDSILIVARLSPEFTANLVDRWQELEEKQKNLAIIPNFNNPVEAARAWADAKESEQKANEKLALSAPKAAAFDLITNAEDELCLRDAAKHLQVRPLKLNSFLQQQGWIFKGKGSGNWTAYQRRIDQGFMVHRRVTFTRTNGDSDTSWQPLITPEGIKFLSLYPAIQEMKKS